MTSGRQAVQQIQVRGGLGLDQMQVALGAADTAMPHQPLDGAQVHPVFQ